MAIYRQIQTSFGQDDFVLKLTPEEKYFYLYLLTNSKTKQCGIYQLPMQVIILETGYNQETAEKLLKRFVDYGKILYNIKTREIGIVNWPRYNPMESPKVRACMEKELKEVKDKSMIGTIYPDRYPLYGVSQEEEEQEKEKAEAEVEEKEKRARALSPRQVGAGTASATAAVEFFQKGNKENRLIIIFLSIFNSPNIQLNYVMANHLAEANSLADLDNIPDPDVLTVNIIENLEAGLEFFREIMLKLGSSK